MARNILVVPAGQFLCESTDLNLPQIQPRPNTISLNTACPNLANFFSTFRRASQKLSIVSSSRTGPFVKNLLVVLHSLWFLKVVKCKNLNILSPVCLSHFVLRRQIFSFPLLFHSFKIGFPRESKHYALFLKWFRHGFFSYVVYRQKTFRAAELGHVNTVIIDCSSACSGIPTDL